MKIQKIQLTGADGRVLPGVIWAPEAPKAVVQLTHGMTEHMGRYGDLAAKLCDAGVALAGFDLRGHGKSGGDPNVASFGAGGWEQSLEDLHRFSRLVTEAFPGVPRFMLGFSLGSFLLREYLGRYPEEALEGAVILGTGQQPGWLLSMLMGVIRGQIKKSGFDGTTDLVRQLSFGTYNQKFKPTRTDADWLCANTLALDEYLADPLVRRDISAGLFHDLLGSMKRTGSVKSYVNWRKDLPVLLLSGENDPVGDGGKGVQAVARTMEKAGLTNVKLCLFPGARHDLLHEKSADDAVAYLLNWLLY